VTGTWQPTAQHCEEAELRREDMSEETKNTFERRRYPRVELMRMDIGMGEQGLTRIIDISASGAQVECPSPLVPGRLYEVHLTFPDRQIRVRVRVTRNLDPPEPAADGQQKAFRAGLEFIGLEPEDQHYLEGYVAGQSQL
jgi:hypothetical protein